MKRLVLFAALVLSTPATAQTVYTTCNLNARTYECSTSVIRNLNNSAKILKLEPREDPQWEAFCQPQRVVGADGIGRYVYAHAGCDVGRSQ